MPIRCAIYTRKSTDDGLEQEFNSLHAQREACATSLPPGLGIDTGTGVISGTPGTADANTTSATVTVTDTAGNPATVSIAFPAVAKGDQTLTGFAYSAATVTYGDTAPAVTAPRGSVRAAIKTGNPRSCNGAVSDQVGINTAYAGAARGIRPVRCRCACPRGGG